MKKWVVRFVSLLVFNIAVLLVIGWLTPARVGWAAVWAGVIVTAATIWIKPLIHRWFQAMAARSASRRTRIGEKLVQFVLVLAVAFLVWILTVLLSSVTVGGGLFGAFWGYVIPPVILVIGWAVYDAIDDRVEAHAGALYDRAAGGRAGVGARGGAPAAGTVPPVPTPETHAARRELNDGLTDEQRRMLDELGKS